MCIHHWNIERIGLTVNGRCRYCGETRQFTNVLAIDEVDNSQYKGINRIGGGANSQSYIPVLHTYERYVY